MKTRVEINLKQIDKNAKEIVNKFNNYKNYIAVLKSEAYGHGEQVANILLKNNINYCAVSYIEEALNIRKINKDIFILCLQPLDLSDIKLAEENNITITVHDKEYLDKLIKLNKKIKIHLKLDTGMNRLGFKDKEEVKEAIEKIEKSDFILEGIYSHFATIGLFDKEYDNQVNKFKELTSLIDLKSIPMVHFSSSVILMTHPKLDFCNTARFGILLYGYNVCPKINNVGFKNKLRLLRNRYYQKKYNLSKTYINRTINIKPSMKMITNIIQIKEIKENECLGYGAYKVHENIKVAILPIGYNNGIGQNNYNRYVLINNKKYYVIGSIGMNMMSVKIDDDVKIDDEVIILGNEITLGELSRFKNSTISQTLIDIGNNNKRVYIK